LNFEALFTALLARAFLRETLGPRVRLALLLMVGGGLLLGAGAADVGEVRVAGLLAVLAATASWGADNVLTRTLAEHDPVEVIAGKAGRGAAATGLLAALRGEALPAAGRLAGLLACGAVGYGLSLRLYLLAQRRIGAARTGSVFALGPFLGAALAWALGDRQGGLALAAGAALLGLGVWLHATERPEHVHEHPTLEHEHAHRHHHRHHPPRPRPRAPRARDAHPPPPPRAPRPLARPRPGSAPRPRPPVTVGRGAATSRASERRLLPLPSRRQSSRVPRPTQRSREA